MAITALTPEQAQTRLAELTIVDVRTPGEFASGHLPGAHNVPLDSLDRATEALQAAAARGPLLVVCASGARSGQACERLSALGIEVATLSGGTQAWAQGGRDVHKPGAGRAVWAMDRQVRFTAGSLVLAGAVAGAFWKPALILSGGVAAGLVYSAVSNTCAMAAMLSKLPHNRPRTGDLDATLAALKG
ncbi:rhodanese-like domain-containing protein [Spirillospora sp. NPDC049652]